MKLATWRSARIWTLNGRCVRLQWDGLLVIRIHHNLWISDKNWTRVTSETEIGVLLVKKKFSTSSASPQARTPRLRLPFSWPCLPDYCSFVLFIPPTPVPHAWCMQQQNTHFAMASRSLKMAFQHQSAFKDIPYTQRDWLLHSDTCAQSWHPLTTTTAGISFPGEAHISLQGQRMWLYKFLNNTITHLMAMLRAWQKIPVQTLWGTPAQVWLSV